MAKLTMDEYCALHEEYRSMPIDKLEDISKLLLSEIHYRKAQEAVNGKDPIKFGKGEFEKFAVLAKSFGLTAVYESQGEGMSTDDMFQTVRYVDKDGDTVGYWQNDPEASEGILCINSTEFSRYEAEENEKNQRFIDDELKAGRNPYQD